jgi:hypothetical protein
VTNGDRGGPGALAAVHAIVRHGNYALSTGTRETGDQPETGAGQARGARPAHAGLAGGQDGCPREVADAMSAGATNVMNFAELL